MFDELKTFPCLTPAVKACGGGSAGGSGGTTTPPGGECCDNEDFRESNPIACPHDDERCSDPLFSAANPLLCPNAPRLVVKPAVLYKETLQQVAYEAVLLTGGEEQIVNGVEWTTDNPGVAVIGSASGKLSTVATGSAMVGASWGGLQASGSVVVGDCGGQTTFVLLIDNSTSMSAMGFSPAYATKLDFAKAMAKRLVQTMDLTKDQVAVMSFNSGTTLRQVASGDSGAIESAINGVGPATASTNLKAAVQGAIDYMAGAGVSGLKVIVVLSDGENKTGGNPLLVAATFAGSGGVVICVGCRAHDSGFVMLDEMASGGFFVNGYEDDQADVPDWLAGLKGYLCSGNCAPPPNTCVPYAQLNYSGFVNWNVSGLVDLIGEGVDTNGDPSGHPLFDFLPGNGLYVDMHGSSSPWDGTLTSKATFDFVADKTYRVRLKVAGNQRQNVSPWSLRVTVGALVDEVITVTDWKQDFTEYSFTFTTGGPVSATIVIKTESNPGGHNPSFGLLLDDVILDSSEVGNFSDTVEIFSDDFDRENLTCLSSTTPTRATGPNMALGLVYHNGLSGSGEATVSGLTAGATYFWKPMGEFSQWMVNGVLDAGVIPPGTAQFLSTDPANVNGIFFVAAGTSILLEGGEEGEGPVSDIVQATSGGDCPPDPCPGTCDGPQIDTFSIVGYSDTFFDLTTCLDDPLVAGETWCAATVVWNGSFTHRDQCNWAAEGTHSEGGQVGINGGKLLYSAGVSFSEDLDAYLMSIEMMLCAGGDLADHVVVWQGSKCGTGPTGRYVKTNGCVPLTSIELGVNGQSSCGGTPNPASGCLDDAPLPAQLPDPAPADDVEPCALKKKLNP